MILFFKRITMRFLAFFSSLGGGRIHELIANTVVFIFKRSGFKQISVRNSTYFKKAILGISDIDLTYIAKNEFEARTFTSFFLKMKRWLPLLTEANVYIESDLGLISRFMNQYELSRDPALESSRSFTEAQSIVFFFRMLKSDVYNLNNYPEVRVAKWSYHFEQLGRSLPDKISLIGLIQSYLAPNIQFSIKDLTKICSYLLFFTEMKCNDSNLNDFVNKNENTKISLLLDTSSWMGAFLSNDFEKEITFLRELDNLNEFEREIVLEQLKWEIVGSLSQMYFYDEIQLKKLKLHILKILRIVNRIGLDSEKSEFSFVASLILI